MDAPVIQLRLKGRLVQTLSFQGDLLRIGRMRENDIVIGNASVSRFHAVLRREGGRVILEDLGSENGCYVNGTRVVKSAVLEPGDEVVIGKHQLVLSEAAGEEELPSKLERQEKSDAWDASNTYFVAGPARAKMLGDAECEEAAVTDPGGREGPPALAELEAAAEEETPAEEMEAAGEALLEAATAPGADGEPEPLDVGADELEAWMPAGADAAEEREPAESIAEAAPEESRQESPFEFGGELDLVSPESGNGLEVDPGEYDVELVDGEAGEAIEQEAETREPSLPEMRSPERPPRFAGLIIQNRGTLERVISWGQDRLSAGRSHECEILLDQAEISRRHAVFVREGERYEVRDLESINGILVNGEKVRRRTLEVGDVVKIEDFEITFLLDAHPIASEIVTEDVSAPVAVGAGAGCNMTMIDENLPTGFPSADPGAGEEPPAPVEEEAETLEESLFGPEEAEKEELAEVEPVSATRFEAERAEAPVAREEVLAFELRVRVEDLPEPFRAALGEVEGGKLSLPVEIVLKGDS
jgi:pSer/pThr/pTyr-binding forkhead associated (FHA) protein